MAAGANPGYAPNAATGYVNANDPNDTPNKINTADGQFILRDGVVKNIYGVSDETLKRIIEEIKLQILRSMTGIPIADLPTTRAGFISAVSNHFNLISQGANTLNSLSTILQHPVQRNRESMDATATNILNHKIPINNVTDNANLDTQAKIIPHINILHETSDGLDISQPFSSTRIQNRLNNCYVLESLYLRKHNELIEMFRFATLLYNKFNYTLRILLYVLSLLTEHVCVGVRDNGDNGDNGDKNPPILINMPKTIIPDIKTLITEQQQMLQAINSVRENINRPINTTDAGIPNVTGINDITNAGIQKIFTPTPNPLTPRTPH